MTRFRLVFPPILATFFAAMLWGFFRLFLPTGHAAGVLAGGIVGYVAYDLTHYYLHHGRYFWPSLRRLKTYHLDHHFKSHQLGFGVTSMFWDVVFGTELPITAKHDN
jgi:sterol desaturase/sphingolipid hydroxylase (fatty acid hydroxylase superfamily)